MRVKPWFLGHGVCRYRYGVGNYQPVDYRDPFHGVTGFHGYTTACPENAGPLDQQRQTLLIARPPPPPLPPPLPPLPPAHSTTTTRRTTRRPSSGQAAGRDGDEGKGVQTTIGVVWAPGMF